MPTIKDVAKKAGVSPSTVSRVLSDHPRITQETKDKVLDVIDEIGYHPNKMAQSLVNQRINNIGLVIPYSAEETFSDPFYSEVLRGIGAVTQTKDYSLLLINYDNQAEEVEETLRAVKGKQVAGLLIMQAKRNDPLVKKLKELDFPFVIVGRPKDEQNNFWVNNDNIQAGKKIVEYLIAQGHRNIGLVAGSKNYTVCQDRWQGYKEALAENRLEYNEDYVCWVEEGTPKETHQQTKEMLKSYPEISAIFGFDDLTAYWVMQAIWELNLKIPDDIAVVGFNNHPLSELINPKLTTVDINIYQLGIKATNLLIKVIDGELEEYTHDIVETDIKIRESSP